ncbi:MAG: hypothetical protein IJ224_11960 [Lachnospiraceae bacterium]|nr:hypothetical protein [Lachnospiraceae bacterium]
MKSKRIILKLCSLFVLAFMVVALSFLSPKADADTTAPIVNSISFSSATYNKGDSFDVTLNLTDEETGVKFIYFDFSSFDNGQGGFGVYKEFDEGFYSGNVVINITIPSDAVAGKYYASSIDITDQAGNRRVYSLGLDDYGYRQDDIGYYMSDNNNQQVKCYIDNGNTITVLSSGDDEAPFIDEITFNNTSCKKGDKVSFTIDYVDDSEISYVYLELCCYRNGQLVYLYPQDSSFICNNNRITYSFYTNDNTPSGNFYLRCINLKDIHGNTRGYLLNGDVKDGYLKDEKGTYICDFPDTSIRAYIKDAQTLKVESTGDEEAPVVSEVSINDDVVKKPGVVNLNVTAKDNERIKSIEVVMYPKTGQQEYGNHDIVGDVDNINLKSGSVTISIPVSMKTLCAQYYVGLVRITDYSGNERLYWNYYDQNGYSIDSNGAYICDVDDSDNRLYIKDKKNVLVEEEFNVKFEMALSNPNLNSAVNNLSAGETGKILIDKSTASKDLFNSIKGKNVNLFFYKDNYQWIFNGKDITNPKDINLDVSFEFVEKGAYNLNNDSLKIIFADNGLLPGKAMMRIKSDYTYQMYQMNKSLSLYYINQDHTLKIEDDSDIRYVLDGTDHWCWFEITHNSSYIATGGSVNQSNTTVDMYRLYNPNSGEHFYTANVKEKDNLVSVGWRYEGIGWKAPAKSNTPVYRLYNKNAGDHHYTMSEKEKDFLVSVGWKYEGIGWYSDDAKSVPLYRQYNPNAKAGSHNYTTSKEENDKLVGLGWKGEGVGWYGVK